MNAHTGKRRMLWLLAPLLMVLGSCRDSGVEPLPELPRNIITLVDTSFTITATRQPATGAITLSVRGTIRFAHDLALAIFVRVLSQATVVRSLNGCRGTC